MRRINYTTRFRRDYRREKSGKRGKNLDALAPGYRGFSRKRQTSPEVELRSRVVRKMERPSRLSRQARSRTDLP